MHTVRTKDRVGLVFIVIIQACTVRLVYSWAVGGFFFSPIFYDLTVYEVPA